MNFFYSEINYLNVSENWRSISSDKPISIHFSKPLVIDGHRSSVLIGIIWELHYSNKTIEHPSGKSITYRDVSHWGVMPYSRLRDHHRDHIPAKDLLVKISVEDIKFDLLSIAES